MTRDTDAAVLLKPLDIAKYLGVGRSLAYELVRSGAFRTVRIGKRLYVRRQTLDRWLAAQDKQR